ncbi:acyl-CoA synthetase [Sphingomonas lacunae]|uniref:Acyl-CoA synthetase n=1 Tax=Sphingomonas lacunae TaxID=2698828 RepID=A0A6M4ASM6_9SPHN|nr:acyl-CoA synthetase [Sphingomonas lacunae]QJQ31430.1 acyl-CoA synthetase [Sphingomonas lacunae]
MTHPRIHAAARPDQPAIIIAESGETLTYGEMERRADQGAHLLRQHRLNGGDTVAMWITNRPEFFEIYWAAQRAGLYITPMATALTAEEAQYIVGNSGAKLLIGDVDIAAVSALFDLVRADGFATCLTLEEWNAARATMPSGRIDDESAGFHMVYSSGTTGRPKGVKLPLTGEDPTAPNNLHDRLRDAYAFDQHTIYLSPAPLYHTAPMAYSTTCHRLGSTVVVMRKFDPVGALKAIERYRITATQMVPTMFVRMLKLPDEERLGHDLSSLQLVIHAAAPCPVEIKRKMIDWFGPIIFEYYAGSEGNGSTGISSEEWLQKPGSVGKATWGILHICDEDGRELPPGEPGIIYFEGGWPFEYLNDPEKTRESRHPQHPDWSMLGDIGYVDEDGYLFLTDRKSFMIISGGVNIYPQEIENVLINHPKVADVAVIGVPNAEMGEEVKAVVQPARWEEAGPALAEELKAYCREHLSPVKCPRSFDFDPALPRLDTGKLYKRLIRDRYWDGTVIPK